MQFFCFFPFLSYSHEWERQIAIASLHSLDEKNISWGPQVRLYLILCLRSNLEDAYLKSSSYSFRGECVQFICFCFWYLQNTRHYSHWCILNATDWSIYLLSARFFAKQDSCYFQLFSPSGVRKLNQELFPSLFLLQSLQQDVETQKAVVKHLEKRVQQTELDSQEKVQIVYFM